MFLTICWTVESLTCSFDNFSSLLMTFLLTNVVASSSSPFLVVDTHQSAASAQRRATYMFGQIRIDAILALI